MIGNEAAKQKGLLRMEEFETETLLRSEKKKDD